MDRQHALRQFTICMQMVAKRSPEISWDA